MKYCYIIFGVFFTILGIIGIFIPILPTTPFLLLSTYLFSKSSTKFYNLIINNKVLGKYIRDYTEKNGISKKNKIISIIFMGIGIIYSFIKMNNLTGRVFLVIIFFSISYHILKLKTIK